MWLLWLPMASAHVSLTFPRARFPPFDFLDSIHTMGPCGVPRPANPQYTDLVVGETYEVTWRMQYPHPGGYRISLLDQNEEVVERLAPLNGIEFAGTQEQTAQSEKIRFAKECANCTMVLERQAGDWGKGYIFHSCADVNILPSPGETTICSGHGALVDGACNCSAGYVGDVCQYLVHCQSDADCQNNGVCVQEKGSLVARVCFCPYGYFGRNCENIFNGEPDKCSSYLRIDQAEYDKYGMYNEACFQSQKLSEDDHVLFREVQDEIEIILDFNTTNWVSIGWRPDGLDPSCRLFPDLEGVRVRRSSSDTIPANPFEDRSRPPTRIEQDGPRPVMPRSNGLVDSALRAPLHAMDCIDIIAATVRDGRMRIQDMYSRDRSTPLEDYWFEGVDSLSAAAGIEVDGRTIIMFRRPKQEIEPTDHPLGGGTQFVAWAKGAHQALNYHGAKHRGSLLLDFSYTPKKPEIAFGVPNSGTVEPIFVFTTSTEEPIPSSTTTKDSVTPASASTATTTTSTTSTTTSSTSCSAVFALSLMGILLFF